MMDILRVRAYNVRFGDALLVSVPDREPGGKTTTRHVLIDVGNVLVGSGGQDQVFEPVLRDVAEVLEGRPLDLYVMTHEHMDHVQGLLWAKEKLDLEIRASHAWLTASAAPGYYERFPGAKEKRLELEEQYRRIALAFATAAVEPPPQVRALLLNNDPRSTRACVDHLRSVGETTTYVNRGVDLSGAHPFQEVRFDVWGPEEDTSIYYGQFKPMALGLVEDEAGGAPRLGAPLPPPGVDAGAFYNLVERRRRGVFDNLLGIDKAANDTSVVFTLTWRGWNLLFPGDAEHRAWKEMDKRGVLRPVHFLKVGHHGSSNGTPPPHLLEKILPAQPDDERPRYAVVSTHEGTYSGVPHRETLADLEGRCARVARIGAAEDNLFVDMEFPDEGSGLTDGEPTPITDEDHSHEQPKSPGRDPRGR